MPVSRSTLKTGTEVLLDTNIVIAILNRLLPPDRIPQNVDFFLSIVSLGELFLGAKKSARRVENLQRLHRLERQVSLLPCDRETADHYSDLRLDLLRKGRPIPANDLWIASTARQYQIPLVTHDRHFDHVVGIELESW
jgi:tRNA(fMet)-specific endonuclease VapC